MAVLAGIDEAGYGPLLGPLVVTGVAFQLPDDAVDGCLWDRLRGCVSRSPGKRDRRLPIADSKKLFHRKTGLKTLERTALVMGEVAGIRARSVWEWMERIAPGSDEHRRGHAWYRDEGWGLPLASDPTGIAMAANAVRRECESVGVRFLGVFCEVILEGEFNRVVGATRNKSTVSLGRVLRIVHRIAEIAPDESVRVCVDRQGGRTRYGPSLMTAFDPWDLRIVGESETRSAYRLTAGGRSLGIEFQTSGEEAHLPVALASVFSKYVRELYMIAFNRYWADRVAGISPTAGYYQDAQRFLAEIEPAMRRERIDRSWLVRCR